MIEVSGFYTLLAISIVLFSLTLFSVYKFKTHGDGFISMLWVPLAFFDTACILALVFSLVRFV